MPSTACPACRPKLEVVDPLASAHLTPLPPGHSIPARCHRARADAWRGRVCAEASGAGQPVEALQQQRKHAWQGCVDGLQRLQDLAAQAAELRARTPAVLLALSERGAPVRGDGDDGVPSKDEVEAMVEAARAQVQDWRAAEIEQRARLQSRTDAAAAALLPEVRPRSLACPRSRQRP